MVELTPIKVYDADLVQIGEIATYSSFNWTGNWYAPSTWELKINQYLPHVAALLGTGYITHAPPGVPVRLGAIETLEPVLDESGKPGAMWTVSGRDAFGAILSQRSAMHGFSTGDGFDTQTDTAYETAMRHLVNKNCIDPTDTKRILAGISLETEDLARGGTADELKTRAEASLLEPLRGWSTASGLHADLIWTPTDVLKKNFVFTITEGTDLSDTVKLSVELGNLKSFKYKYSILDYKTLLYVLGSGDGASRLLNASYAGATEPTGWARRETTLEASDCDTVDAMVTQGKEALAEKGITESLEFGFNPETQSYTYRDDFELGDIVTAIVNLFFTDADPEQIEMAARIVSVSETYDENGTDIKISAGTSAPDLVDLFRDVNKNISALMRR